MCIVGVVGGSWLALFAGVCTFNVESILTVAAGRDGVTAMDDGGRKGAEELAAGGKEGGSGGG